MKPPGRPQGEFRSAQREGFHRTRQHAGRPARAASPRGFAILTAIFLIVVLSLLGAMIVSLSTGQQVGQVRDLLGTRAMLAARAGVEWGVYRVTQSGSCAASATLPALSGSAAGFTVVVACSAFGPYDEAGSPTTVYQITSTASIGTVGAPDRAERQLQAVLSLP